VLLQADSNAANVVGEENGDGGVIFEFHDSLKLGKNLIVI